eukprot:s2759_g7.t1
MEYLMFLCKVCNMEESQLVGSSLAEKVEEQQAMRVRVKMFKQVGMSSSTAKSLMRVVLLNALSICVAMDSNMNDSKMVCFEHAIPYEMAGVFKLTLAFALTFFFMMMRFLCLTANHGAELQQRLRKFQIDCNLKKALEILRGAMGNRAFEIAEEESKTEDPVVSPSSSVEMETERDRCARYQQSSLEEVSDDEYWSWRFIHHGRPDDDEEPVAHRSYTDSQLESLMRETNDLLNSRIRRPQGELEQAALVNDQMAMDAVDAQVLEAQHLLYNI